MSEVTGGVSRLVSRPRKKQTKNLIANNNVGISVSLPKKQQRPRDAFLPTRRGRGRQCGIA